MSGRLLIAGYPKSGNTWLGYMLAYMLGARYVDEHSEQITRLKSVVPYIDGCQAHDTWFSAVVKTHATPNNVADLQTYDRIVHLIRDPRDVAVSHFYYKRYNSIVAIEDSDRILARQSKVGTFINWKKHVKQSADKWALHSVYWSAYNTILIRYEDIHSNPSASLTAICKYIDVAPDSDLIVDAIDLFSFERLSGGRSKGDENKYHFFRKGLVGDHANHFSALDYWIMRRVAGDQMSRYGYE